MNFSRKLILVAGAALLAACGDKVQVVGPGTGTTTPPVTKVNSVDVSPATATITAGQSITFTAGVNADAGVTYTTAWTSSVSTVTVGATTGVVTTTSASVTAGAAICATVTAGTQVVKNCGTLIVTPVSQVLPASVSIASITTNVGGLNAPVNVANVVGQIDIKVNVLPGNQTVSKVVLVVGGTRTDSQTFTAAQSAALRYTADEAVAAQSTFPQILFSVNTAKFNATTGIPSWLNGAQGVSVQLYTTQGGSATAATATAQTTLTFNNVDGYAATVVTSGTTANALSSTGFRYDRGGLDVTVLPVIYSGRTIASATLYFGSVANCDAQGTGQRNTTLTAPASGSNAWTKTGWAQTTPSGSSTVNFLSYEFQTASNVSVTCQTVNATGETIAVTAVDANGDAVLAQAAPLNVGAANSLRLDNRAPAVGAPLFMANPNGRQNGWINPAVALNGSSTTMSATSNNWLFSAPSVALNGQTTRDYGQGTYTRFIRIASSATGTISEAKAATASSAATLPAPSVANNTYCAVATAQDLLGNETSIASSSTACGAVVVAANAAANSGLSTQLFGVDIAAPVITPGSSTDNATYLDANERRGAAATMVNNFGVSVVDTGTVGNSGMLTNMAVMGTVTLRNDANSLLTVATKCIVGDNVTDTAVCAAAAVNTAPAAGLPWVVVAPSAGNSAGATAPGAGAVTAQTAPGYYTYTAYARDAAGNQSGTITKVVAFDVLGNIPALTSSVYNTPLTGGSVTFNATASDNFDLWKAAYALTYATLPGPVVYPSTTINTFNGTQLYSNVAAGITIPNFVRQVELITAQAPIVIGAGAGKPTALNGTVTDQSDQVSAVANTVIPGASVTTGVSYLASAAPQLVRSFEITNLATNISDGSGTPANATSVTLVADVFGATATFNPPFARVDFYAFFGGNLIQIGTTTSVVSVDDGSAFGRRHRYTISWTPGTSFGSNVATALYAVGVNTAGDALVTPVSGTITITTP